jgi:hypothetical protein
LLVVQLCATVLEQVGNSSSTGGARIGTGNGDVLHDQGVQLALLLVIAIQVRQLSWWDGLHSPILSLVGSKGAQGGRGKKVILQNQTKKSFLDKKKAHLGRCFRPTLVTPMSNYKETTWRSNKPYIIGAAVGFLLGNFLCERLALAFGERGFIGRGLLTIAISMIVGKAIEAIANLCYGYSARGYSFIIGPMEYQLLQHIAFVFIDKVAVIAFMLFVDWSMPWAIKLVPLNTFITPLTFKWDDLWSR